MTISRFHRIGLLATVAFCTAVSLAPVRAQSPVMFEETPSLERLRSIMIPESTPGVSRSIVIGRPSAPQPATETTRVSSTAFEPAPPLAAPPPAPVPVSVPEAGASPSARTEEAAPEPARRARVPRAMRRIEEPRVLAAAIPAGIVGFHIPFAPDSDVVPPTAQPFLDRIADLLHEQAGLKLLVEGHTDAYGSVEHNLTLSKRRAQSVATYLAGRSSVSTDRLMVAGMGKSAPLIADPFDARNRRVQFVRVQ